MLLTAAAPAVAGSTPLEVIPEANVYLRLGDTARLFLLADVTESLSDGTTDGEVGTHLDLTLKPILRRRLRRTDWERDRYFWIRLGYRLIGNLNDRETGVTEHRGLVEATTRVPLPAEVWLVNRVRVDRRDVDGHSSTRFGERIGIEREFAVARTTLVPYVQAEGFYDTRFDAWNRQCYQAGVEIELNQHLRAEPSYTRQKDQRSSASHLDRIGFVLKFYY
jgi:hypothetical protein